MALVGAEGFADERLGDLDGLVHRVLPRADGHHVGVVVLARERRDLGVPGQGGTHAHHLVRRDLLAVPGPADDDAEAVRLGHHRLARGEADGRVVVQGVVGEGPVVHQVVPLGGQLLDEDGLQLEPSVVRGDVDAHGAILPHGRPPEHGSRPVRAVVGPYRARRGLGRRLRLGPCRRFGA